jgi:phosphoribosylformylglycinamidine cyclo-ligase
LHTNGFSLARKILADLDWNTIHPQLNMTPGEALLAIHRCYFNSVRLLWEAGVDIRGLAHITGGGVLDNLPRILPDYLGATIRRGTWVEPPIFGLLERLGSLEESEMFHAFNMGLGMLVIVAPEQVENARAVLPGELSVVGEITMGAHEVLIRR